MSGGDDHELINFIATTVEGLRARIDEISDQMATKDDIVRLESRMEIMREQMATKEDLARVESRVVHVESKLNTVDAKTTAIRGDIEQVHIRLDSIDRAVGTRVGQIETDVSRLRSVVYLLVKDKPDMLRLLGQTTPRENPPQG
jgi:outer membrane murein-binding lipoprotein Lpp